MNVSGDMLEAIYQATRRLEQAWLPTIPSAHEFFAYEPLPWGQFIDLIEQASGLTEGRRFLDVGCGIGTKLIVMHYLGWEVAGVERHPPYAHAARLLVPEAEEVTPRDVFDIDRFDADVVYSYRLAVNDDRQAEVEAHLSAHMTPGSVLVLPNRHPEIRVI